MEGPKNSATILIRKGESEPQQLSRYSASLRTGRYGAEFLVGQETFVFTKTLPDRPWGPPNLLEWVLGLFPWVKRPGRGADYPAQSSAEVRTEQKSTATPPL